MVCPVYEDPAEQDGSPFDLNNASPFSWSWLSTINRVNSQVQKVWLPCFLLRNDISWLRQLHRPLSCHTSPFLRDIGCRKTFCRPQLVSHITPYGKSYYDGSYRRGCEISTSPSLMARNNPVIHQPSRYRPSFDSSVDGRENGMIEQQH